MELKEKISESEIRKRVRTFNNSKEYYLHRLSDNWTLHLTEGCFFIREMANAYWLFDLILSYQGSNLMSPPGKQAWKVRRYKNKMVQVSCQIEKDDVMIIQVIKKKSFPLDEITIIIDGCVARLPTEG